MRRRMMKNATVVVSCPQKSPGWISTGINSGSDLAVEMKIKMNSIGNQCLWCSRTYLDLNTHTSFIIYSSFRFDVGDKRIMIGTNVKLVIGEEYVFKVKDNYIYINGNKEASYDGKILTTSCPVYLFASATNTITDTPNGNVAAYTIYYAKIWKGNKLVRDFIPLASGTIIRGKILTKDALYDKITNTLYYYNTSFTEKI